MSKYYLNDDGIAYLWSKLENKISDNLIYYAKTTAQWNSDLTKIVEKNVLYIYTDYRVIKKDDKDYWMPGLKLGDGTSYLIDLPILNDEEDSEFNQLVRDHLNNNIIHITPEERNFWNNKLNYQQGIQNEILVLNRQ